MATVPVTRTFVAGEIVLASYFNANIRDVLNYLLAPPIMELRQQVVQSIPNSAFTAVTFTTEDVDSSGMHSTSVNTSRATAVYPGWYQETGSTAFAVNATGSRGSSYYINGATQNSVQSLHQTVGASHNHREVAVTKMVFMNVSDYVELMTFQASGGALNSIAGGSDGAGFGMRWVSN